MGGVVLETESDKLLRRGATTERVKTVKNMLNNGFTTEEISKFCGYDLDFVNQVAEGFTQAVQ
jgi:hypothetical protein